MPLKIKEVNIDSLVGYARNARTHSEIQISQVAESIKEFGFCNPVLVGDDGGIIAGHCRVLAAKKLGIKSVPTVALSHLNENQRRAYILADNKLALNAGWDDAMLAEEIKALQADGFDVSIAGFDAEELSALTAPPQTEGQTDPDDAPEPPAEPKSERGKIYQCGKHRVMCGDSTKDIKSFLAADRPTLVFTDPPYGVAIGDKNRMLEKFQKCGRNTNDIESDNVSPADLKKILLAVFTDVDSCMADDCSVFVCSPQGGGLGMMMMMMMQESGLEVRHIINWVKNSPTFSMGRLDYDYQHEPILYTWGKKHKRIMAGDHKTSVWAVNKPVSSKEHPTMKPVELPVNAILNHTDSGDIVFDPFLGSGTTMIASEKTGRVCRGIELMPNYADVIRKRWAEFVHGKDCDWEKLTPEIAK